VWALRKIGILTFFLKYLSLNICRISVNSLTIKWLLEIYMNRNDIGKDFTELDRDYFGYIKIFVTCPLKLNTIGKLPYVAKK